ncbi:MAG: MarR family winged helix-turn-helix transcriptional regulator [Pseudomonadota bacterium]
MEDAQRPDDPSLDYGILHDLIGHLLRLAYNRATLSFAQEVGRDLTPLQFMILELLSRNPGIRHSRLAEGLDCSASVLTTALKGLIASGRVEAMPGTDQRHRTYRITGAGAADFDTLRHRIDASEARLTNGLSEADRARLRAILRAIAKPAGSAENSRTGD